MTNWREFIQGIKYKPGWTFEGWEAGGILGIKISTRVPDRDDPEKLILTQLVRRAPAQMEKRVAQDFIRWGIQELECGIADKNLLFDGVCVFNSHVEQQKEL